MPTRILESLMKENNVTSLDIQKAVAKKGYYSINTPIDSYDPCFISAVLVGAWQQVLSSIMLDLHPVCGQISGQRKKLNSTQN